MASKLGKKFKVNARKYDEAVKVIRNSLGSYETIAALCFTDTKERISGNAIRRWFLSRDIPVEYAALFSELTLGDVTVNDFFPWLDSYL